MALRHLLVHGTIAFATVGSLALAVPAKSRDQAVDSAKIERGRYLTVITGCNDCHTPGYAEADGKLPVRNWLVGNTLGYRGPWGTTYAPNLRHYFEKLSEDQWVKAAKNLKTRPPMPWFSVNAIAGEDLRAMYAFVRSLGPGGAASPKALPPGEQPSGPTVDWPMATN